MGVNAYTYGKTSLFLIHSCIFRMFFHGFQQIEDELVEFQSLNEPYVRIQVCARYSAAIDTEQRTFPSFDGEGQPVRLQERIHRVFEKDPWLR
jgi:hypothetical protein